MRRFFHGKEFAGLLLGVFLCGNAFGQNDSHDDLGEAYSHAWSEASAYHACLCSEFPTYGGCTSGAAAEPIPLGGGGFNCNITNWAYDCQEYAGKCGGYVVGHVAPSSEDCLGREGVPDIFSSNEPEPICRDGCQFEATTGTCTEDGECLFNTAPTGNYCHPDEGNEDPLPDNCIRNESTGAVACDCSVDPSQYFCVDPDTPDPELPPGCIRNESTGVIICAEGPPDPDPPDEPDPGDPDDTPVPGDTDGDGVCEVGEECEGDNIQNEILQDILDSLKGTGLDTGVSADGIKAAADQFNQDAKAQGGVEGLDDMLMQPLEEGMDDMIQDIQGGFFGAVGVCPVIDQQWNGIDVTIDFDEVGSLIRAIVALMMWISLAWWAYSIFITSATGKG